MPKVKYRKQRRTAQAKQQFSSLHTSSKLSSSLKMMFQSRVLLSTLSVITSTPSSFTFLTKWSTTPLIRTPSWSLLIWNGLSCVWEKFGSKLAFRALNHFEPWKLHFQLYRFRCSWRSRFAVGNLHPFAFCMRVDSPHHCFLTSSFPFFPMYTPFTCMATLAYLTNCLPDFQLAAKSLRDQMLLDTLLVPFLMSAFLMTTQCMVGNNVNSH